MFVSASTRCFAEMDFWQSLRQIADLEFDKVEFWLDEEGALKPSVILNEPEEFQAQLRDLTRLSTIGFSLAQDLDAQAFSNLCKLCKNLRITQITVPSAVIGTPFNSEIDRLKELCKIAAVEGVRVSIKTESGRLSADPHTAVELCQATKGLGISFDPSYFVGPQFEEIMDLVAPHTFHVHLRDSTEKEIQVQVGLGEVDYNTIISQLQRCHYDRALSVEIYPDQMDSEQRALELRKLRMLLDSLL